MRQRKNYVAVDNFRLIAALLIVAIHTAPLASFSDSADFLVTYCFARVAVPFFLMVTGYFVLAPYQRTIRERGYFQRRTNPESSASVQRFLKKTAALYVISTLLYLPLKIYAGNISHTIGEWLKEFFFDGTFYHLWYLPAVLTGCLLLILLLQFCSPFVISILVFALYVIGVLGDSYYNLVSQVPVLKMAYEGIFQISSYTRNGIFFAPVFLWMGVVLANGGVKLSLKAAASGFGVSMAAMLAEGYLSYSLQWQKHNSMYFLLIPVMFYLFELLLFAEVPKMEIARDLSMYVYILHPLSIVLVRGVASPLKMKSLLVEQSLIHYLAVVAVTVLLSLVLVSVKRLTSGRYLDAG